MADKTRFFAVVTYRTDINGLLQLLEKRSSSIRAYALIKHDKDEADPHCHIVLRTYSAWKPLNVAKWFEDESGQNTFAQPVHDRQGIIDYLTHDGVYTDKAHYDKSEIIDGGLSDLLPSADGIDDSFEILQAMLSGTSVYELCKRYGRDFIYHYTAYALIVDKIKEENGQDM